MVLLDPLCLSFSIPTSGALPLTDLWIDLDLWYLFLAQLREGKAVSIWLGWPRAEPPVLSAVVMVETIATRPRRKRRRYDEVGIITRYRFVNYKLENGLRVFIVGVEGGDFSMLLLL